MCVVETLLWQLGAPRSVHVYILDPLCVVSALPSFVCVLHSTEGKKSPVFYRLLCCKKATLCNKNNQHMPSFVFFFCFFFGVNHKPRKWSYKDDIRSAGHRGGLNRAVWLCNMASGPAKQLHTAGCQFIPGTVREEREEIEASSHRAGIEEGRECWHMGALGGDMNRCPALPPEWSPVHSYCSC